MNKNTQNENKKTARRTCREALSTVGGITPYNQRPGAGAAENKRLPQLGRRGGKARAGEKTARRLAEMTNSSTIQPIVVARDEVVLRYDDRRFISRHARCGFGCLTSFRLNHPSFFRFWGRISCFFHRFHSFCSRTGPPVLVAPGGLFFHQIYNVREKLLRNLERAGRRVAAGCGVTLRYLYTSDWN